MQTSADIARAKKAVDPPQGAEADEQAECANQRQQHIEVPEIQRHAGDGEAAGDQAHRAAEGRAPDRDSGTLRGADARPRRGSARGRAGARVGRDRGGMSKEKSCKRCLQLFLCEWGQSRLFLRASTVRRSSSRLARQVSSLRLAVALSASSSFRVRSCAVERRMARPKESTLRSAFGAALGGAGGSSAALA